MDMNETNMKVSDLGLAAALVTCGFEILQTTRDPYGRANFFFEENAALADTINAYWADSLELKARKYFDNTKMLKVRIYAK